MFQKILIANRGEIAVRIIRACRELGIKTVAVYSQADSEALHTQLADEAICIGPAKSSDSYLNMERIISATIAAKADAIHPGFGFLSENSKFAEMCEKCKIAFIGPPPEVMTKMGNKSEARSTMRNAGVPVVPGTREAVYDAKRGLELAGEIGFPVMIKASSGGGGKGMRVSETPGDFMENFKTAQMESVKGFGDNTMYIEKYVKNPRHIEFQILADKFGNVVQLGERDCSIQRNHQKVIEESPSPALSADLRARMGAEAVCAARAAGYENAGTIEFLLDEDQNFYFMEMNTRIQVEHPVTEMVSGVDLIKEQISIAAGRPLSVTQEDIRLQGHAMECRINAEDPSRHFRPCPGTLQEVHLPGGFGVRIDSAVYSGYEIPPYYDSMIAKVIVHDKTREGAIDKMRSTLGELILDGVTTNLDFQYEILNDADFQKGNFNTSFIETHFPQCIG
ncbi:MAG: acetyl-CoA carboxylase biotin carboxylase subunit [Candidatus Limivivens sp.]|nr:acetyl-CoA carboxylase biotin carboxylase subunit [Candidatus Limivivens sp.]